MSASKTAIRLGLRSQCPLQELHMFLLDELELELQFAHQKLVPDLRQLTSSEAHLAGCEAQQDACDPSQRTWETNC